MRDVSIPIGIRGELMPAMGFRSYNQKPIVFVQVSRQAALLTFNRIGFAAEKLSIVANFRQTQDGISRTRGALGLGLWWKTPVSGTGKWPACHIAPRHRRFLIFFSAHRPTALAGIPTVSSGFARGRSRCLAKSDCYSHS